jgi:hypothetical protein
MWFSSWFLKRTVSSQRRPANRCRPQLEVLEDRAVPATFLVNTTLDVPNSHNDGLLSLRQAIIDANKSSKTADTIVLPAGDYALTQAGAGDLAITAPLTINGAGAGSTIVDAAGLYRVFEMSNVAVTLSGMTIQGGNAVNTGSGAYSDWGGGIWNAYLGGSLTVNNCVISGNTAAYAGGGIFSASSLTLNNSVLSGNSAAHNGGGIANHGTMTVSNCTFSGNSAHGLGGGAIWNEPAATATLQYCTLSGNSALNYGGGILIDSFGNLTVSHSTFSINSASQGGGIANLDGTATVQYSTLSGNSASQGGGIFNYGTLTVSNSTLSGNSASQGGGIYNYVGAVTVSDSILSRNSASDSGGGIFNAQSSAYNRLTISGSTVLNNTASVGADIYNLEFLSISNSTIGIIGP